MWFDNRARFDIDFFEVLQPQRIVSEHYKYKSGLYYSTKCQRQVQYESGLELNFIQLLEQSKKVLFYYEQPVRIRYYRARRKQTYTPDFGVYLDTKEFVLVEIKDLNGMAEDRVQLKTEALMDFCSKKGFGLLLTDGRYCFDKLLKIKNNRQLEKEILTAIDENVLRKKRYNEIMKKCDSTRNELLKLIIKHNLKYRSFPFKLQHGGNNELFRKVFVEKKRYDDVITERFSALFGSK